jgi:hypothetical protein
MFNAAVAVIGDISSLYWHLVIASDCNSYIFGLFLLQSFQETPEAASLVPVFAKWFPQLSPPIFIIKFRAWYVKYAALHGISFGGVQCSISSILSKWF